MKHDGYGDADVLNPKTSHPRQYRLSKELSLQTY
jgi:hypothetical protein